MRQNDLEGQLAQLTCHCMNATELQFINKGNVILSLSGGWHMAQAALKDEVAPSSPCFTILAVNSRWVSRHSSSTHFRGKKRRGRGKGVAQHWQKHGNHLVPAYMPHAADDDYLTVTITAHCIPPRIHCCFQLLAAGRKA